MDAAIYHKKLRRSRVLHKETTSSVFALSYRVLEVPQFAPNPSQGGALSTTPPSECRTTNIPLNSPPAAQNTREAWSVQALCRNRMSIAKNYGMDNHEYTSQSLRPYPQVTLYKRNTPAMSANILTCNLDEP